MQDFFQHSDDQQVILQQIATSQTKSQRFFFIEIWPTITNKSINKSIRKVHYKWQFSMGKSTINGKVHHFNIFEPPKKSYPQRQRAEPGRAEHLSRWRRTPAWPEWLQRSNAHLEGP